MALFPYSVQYMFVAYVFYAQHEESKKINKYNNKKEETGSQI